MLMRAFIALAVALIWPIQTSGVMTREVVIGIDFGTSCTSAGVMIDGRVALLEEAGDSVIPSVVYVPDRGSPEVGRTAAVRQLTDPTRVLRSIKRVLGVPAGSAAVQRFAGGAAYRVEVTGERVMLKLRSGDCTPEQVAAWILSRIRDLAERAYGGTVRKAIITMSAGAPPFYRDAIIRAGRIAHLDVLDLVSEPIAGGLAIGLHTAPANRKVLVCDFGGGTFDVSALVQQGLRFTTIAAHGDAALGGDDLDDAVAEALASFVYKRASYDLHKDQVRWNELLLRCESAKRQLSSSAEAPLVMRDAYLENGQRKDLSIVLDRPWVEHCWRPLFERACTTVRELLVRAKWTARDVDAVALVGGAAQVPQFQRAIGEMFPDRVSIAPRADVAVALGAALLTARFAATPRPVPVLEAAAS
jgi:molecular chaperone DnaK